MGQTEKESIRSEFDHEYKYRFLYLNDKGDILPIYSSSQTVPGGAGDLILTFTGHSGSGFEYCDVTTQTLTRGSQYQTSFLPEMQSKVPYKIKVHAQYKDFIPIDFELEVKYLPNLSGKTKFVDLGTHVFYKNNTKNVEGTYKISMTNVIDSLVEDDIDTYTITLNDGIKNYYSAEDQENIVHIQKAGVPKLGENIIKVSDDDGNFLQSKRNFINLPG